MNRINSLRDKMLKGEHGKYRILMPSDWSVSNMQYHGLLLTKGGKQRCGLCIISL
jgi:hypothetical protein